MKRLCYGTFATVLKLCPASGATQVLLHNALLSCVDESGVERDDGQASRCFSCNINLSKDAIEKMRVANPEAIKTLFSEKVIPLIDPNKIETAVLAIRAIIADDEEISTSTVIDYVSNATKASLLRTPISAPIDFLAGVFMYVVLCVKNKVGQDCIKDIDEDFIAKFQTQTITFDCSVAEITDISVITESRPLHPSDYFRGRDTKLDEIKSRLSGKAKLLLLNGMGGYRQNRNVPKTVPRGY